MCMHLQVILTRVNPAERRSSIIVRVRPGWKELYNFLASPADAQAPRC